MYPHLPLFPLKRSFTSLNEWNAWGDVRAYGASEGISVDRMRGCYVDAIHWSDGVLDEASV